MIAFKRLFPLLAACCFSQALAAQPVYKCSADGKTSYSDRPCAHGRSAILPPPAAGVAPEGAETVATRDSRTLLELEKMRIAREERALREQREQERASRTAGLQRKKCARLRLRHKWAEEDVAKSHGKARTRAQTKARRAAETLAVECPA